MNNETPRDNENQVNNTESMVPETPAEPEVPAEPEAPAAPKKIGALPFIIGGVAVIAIIVAVLFGSNFSNAFRKIFSSPEGYAEHIVSTTVEDTVSTVKDSAEDYLEYLEKGVTSNLDVTITLEKEGKAFIEDNFGYLNEEYYTWFNTATFDVSAEAKNTEISLEASAKLNKEKLVTAEVVVDDNKVYFSFPDYNKKAIFAEIPDMPSMNLAPIIKALDLDLMEKLILSYTGTVMDSVDVTEQTVSVSAGGVSGKLTESKIELDGKLMKNVATAILKKAQKDKDIEKLLKQFEKVYEAAANELEGFYAEDFDADELYSELIEEIDYALEELESLDSEYMEYAEKPYTISVYSDSNGDFAGIKLYDPNEKITLFKMLYITSGSEAGFEMSASEYSYYWDEAQTIFEIKANGTEKGDKLSADFKIESYGSMVYEFKTKDLDLNKLEDGILKGELIFPIPVDEFEDFEISILSNSTNNEEVDLKIALIDDNKELITLEAKGNVKSGASINAPKDAIDSEDYEKIGVWATDTLKSVSKNLPKVLKKAKLPTDIIEMIEEALESALDEIA